MKSKLPESMSFSADAVWANLYKELFAFVNKKVKDRPSTEDILQDVFIKVHINSGQLRETEKISGWIYQIAKNSITDHFRKTGKTIAPVDVDWNSNPQELNDCMAICLKVMLHTLPDQHRVPLVLTEIENLSQSEVADRLKISYSGARSRIQRARKKLRKKMEELFLIKTDAYGNVTECIDRNPKCCKHEC